MLSDRINTALEALNITITDVARSGGCTPSNLNRLKNGIRTPASSSPTIEKLTVGLIGAADDRLLFEDLCRLCGAPADSSRQQLKKALIEWLYIDESPYERTYRAPAHTAKKQDVSSRSAGQLPLFSARLDLLMRSAGLSNKRLASETALDPSYISRLRRGERLPRFNSHYLESICIAIWNTFNNDCRLFELASLISRREEELTDVAALETIREWLFGYDTIVDHQTVNQLVGAVASIEDLILATDPNKSRPESIDIILENCFAEADSLKKIDDERQSVGIDGIRSMVKLFLAEALSNDEREILLYSDQPMDWMSGNYSLVLTTLMTECINKNIHIKIIHTVNRSITELTAAITWWMPLYLSGNIESYYCRKSAGTRFSHSLFIRPDTACIAGTSVRGMEHKTVYTYSKTPEIVALAQDSFLSLLSESEPLVTISPAQPEAPEDITMDEVIIKASLSQVVITRTDEPRLSFTFTHPMICRAFEAYIKSR